MLGGGTIMQPQACRLLLSWASSRHRQDVPLAILPTSQCSRLSGQTPALGTTTLLSRGIPTVFWPTISLSSCNSFSGPASTLCRATRQGTSTIIRPTTSSSSLRCQAPIRCKATLLPTVSSRSSSFRGSAPAWCKGHRLSQCTPARAAMLPASIPPHPPSALSLLPALPSLMIK